MQANTQGLFGKGPDANSMLQKPQIDAQQQLFSPL